MANEDVKINDIEESTDMSGAKALGIDNNGDTKLFKLDTVPPGGAAGKILVKVDGADYNSQWANASTDNVTEGTSNKYHTPARVLASALTGLSVATNAAITDTDTVLTAPGKLQAQITGHATAISANSTAISNENTRAVGEENLRVKTITLTNLRAYNGVSVPSFYVNSFGIEGTFTYFSFDTTSADDGVRIIVDAAGRRYYRQNYASKINVKWFGAKGDGTTDDTTAIQNAFNLASLNSFAGNARVIYFPAGTYLVNSLTLAANTVTVIRGDGVLHTVLKAKPNITGSVLNIPGTTIIDFADFAVDGNKAAHTTQTGVRHGIQFTDIATYTIYIKSGKMNNMLVRDTDGDGIHGGQYKQELFLDRVEIYSPNGHGIYQNPKCADWYISNITVSGATGTGMYGVYIPNMCNLTMSAITLCTNGVYLGVYCRNSVISNCQIDRHLQSAIVIEGQELTGDGVTKEYIAPIIKGCYIQNNSQAGDGLYPHILITHSSNVRIVHCTFIGSPTDTNDTGKQPNYIVNISGGQFTRCYFSEDNATSPLNYRTDRFNDYSKIILLSPYEIPNRKAVADAAYTVLPTDIFIAVTSLTAARTLTMSALQPNHVQTFKDESGNAGTYNITINAPSGKTIDGASSKVISSNYGFVKIYFNGTNYFTTA